MIRGSEAGSFVILLLLKLDTDRRRCVREGLKTLAIDNPPLEAAKFIITRPVFSGDGKEIDPPWH